MIFARVKVLSTLILGRKRFSQGDFYSVKFPGQSTKILGQKAKNPGRRVSGHNCWRGVGGGRGRPFSPHYQTVSQNTRTLSPRVYALDTLRRNFR